MTDTKDSKYVECGSVGILTTRSIVECKLLQTPRYKWQTLGDAIVKKEHQCIMTVSASKYITLRLDGNGFTNKMRTLRNAKALDPHGFSLEFHAIMMESLQNLCMCMNAVLGFTQSDEMTIVLAPAGEHIWGGRRDKLISLTASFVSVSVTTAVHRALSNVPSQFMMHFDCRLAVHDTWEDALQMILWRSYDAFVNGISDTVYQSGLPGRKKIAKLHSFAKIKWLRANNLWPTHDQRLYGTILKRETITKDAINELTNEPVTCQRRIWVPQPRKDFCMEDYCTVSTQDKTQ